jgi:hypothetical protein
MTNPKVPNVLVVTDIGNDYDDMMALLILGYYHKLKKINLLGVIVTLKPALERAQMAHGLLQCMGIHNVEVAKGTEEALDKADKVRESHSWTKEALTADFITKDKTNFRDHKQLSRSVFKMAEEGEKIRFVSLAGLTTLWEIVEEDEELFVRAVSEVHCQGGCQWDPAFNSNKVIMARPDARNNQDDMDAANKFYKFVHVRKIPVISYEKEAAYKSTFPKTIFNPDEASPSMKGVAKYIYNIHDRQMTTYYERTYSGQHFAENMDRDWFVGHLCIPSIPVDLAKDEQCPAEKIIPYTIVVPYDPITALGSIGEVAGVNIPRGPVQYSISKPKEEQNTTKLAPKAPSEQEPMGHIATCKDLTEEQGIKVAESIKDHMRRVLGHAMS